MFVIRWPRAVAIAIGFRRSSCASLLGKSIVLKSIAALAFALIVGTGSAPAAPISWAVWDSPPSEGPNGSATGTAGGVGLSYSGEVLFLTGVEPSWNPQSTFAGGTIPNAPVSGVNRAIALTGNSAAGTNTTSFSTPVLNPVMAFWSLGALEIGLDASFVFDTSAFSMQSGGPNAEHGGSSIIQVSNIVHGIEGNGTIQFLGLFSAISWTNPTTETHFAFTVGVETPLPAALPLFASAIGVMGLIGWRRRTRLAR